MNVARSYRVRFSTVFLIVTSLDIYYLVMLGFLIKNKCTVVTNNRSVVETRHLKWNVPY